MRANLIRAARPAGLLAAAWLVPALAHLVHADALMLVLLWLGTASLLRTGGTLLDRLVPALALTASGVMAAGLLTSVWPWGIAPVPLSGLGLTILLVVAVCTGRRPALPRRVLGTDLLITAGGLLAAGIAARPKLKVDGYDRLAYAFVNGDRVRHFNLFDTILRIGGYPALRADEARVAVEPEMLRQYPAGTHYLYATIDTFVTGGHPGTILSEVDRYFLYTVAGFGFFVLALAWAARRVAGPQLAGVRRTALVAAVCGFAGLGFYTTMLWEGFDSQILGMALLAVLVAVLARPPRSTVEQFMLIGALTAAITLTYTLFTLFAAVGIAATLLFQWKRVRARLWWVLCLGAGFGAVAAVQPVIWYLRSWQAQNQLNADGFIMPFPTTVLIGLSFVVAFGLSGRLFRRSPRVRLLAVLCGSGWAMIAAMYAYNMASVGHQSYYFQKFPQVLGVVLLVALGPTLARIRVPVPRKGMRARFASVAVVVAALAVTGGVPYGSIRWDHGRHLLGADVSWGRVWASGRINTPVGPMLAYLDERGMLADGVATVVFFAKDGPQNKQASLILGALNRDLGVTALQCYAAKGKNLVGAPLIDQAELKPFLTMMGLVTVPLRVLVNDKPLADTLSAYVTAHPGASPVSIVYLPDMPGAVRPKMT